MTDKKYYSMSEIIDSYSISNQTLYNYMKSMSKPEKAKYIKLINNRRFFTQQGLDFVLQKYGYKDKINNHDDTVSELNEIIDNLKKQLEEKDKSIINILDQHHEQIMMHQELLRNQQVLTLNKVEEIKLLEEDLSKKNKSFFNFFRNK